MGLDSSLVLGSEGALGDTLQAFVEHVSGTFVDLVQGELMFLLQEAILDLGQRVCQRGMTLAAFGHAGEDGVLVVVELLLEIGGVLGRLFAGDVFLPVGQPVAEEVVRIVFLLNDVVESIQVMVGITFLLSLLLPLVRIFEADAHFQSRLTLTGRCIVEHFLLLVGVHSEK